MLRRSFLSAAALAAAQEPLKMQLFLLIGQSNMAGRGKVKQKDREPIARVFSLTESNDWAPAVDPLHFDKPKIAGVGLGRSFARVLAMHNPGAVIGLIPAAFGGSSLAQWSPGGELYANAVRRAKTAMASGTLRGILWHQGEADSEDEENAKTYGERWKAFAGALRAELGPAPIVVGALGDFLASRPGNASPFFRAVNEQLAMLPARVPGTAYVPAGGLKDRGDHLHFNSASQRELGRRYACAFLMLDPFSAGGRSAKDSHLAPPPQ